MTEQYKLFSDKGVKDYMQKVYDEYVFFTFIRVENPVSGSKLQTIET